MRKKIEEHNTNAYVSTLYGINLPSHAVCSSDMVTVQTIWNEKKNMLVNNLIQAELNYVYLKMGAKYHNFFITA